jgi:hypothetical protein
MSTTPPLPCLVCNRPLKPVFPDHPLPSGYIQPSQANTLTSRGTYGSEIFDPLDGALVAVNVCDPCLKAAIKGGTAEILHPAS